MPGPLVAIATRFFSICAVLLWIPAASAAVCQFNQTSGAWNVPANWNNCSGGNGVPAGTPGPADRAEITGATANLPAGVFTVGDLYLGSATIQGSGIGATTLNVVAAGTIAWGSGFYNFNGLTVNLSSTMAIPAANGPLNVTNAVLRIAGSSTHLLADTITVTGAAAKLRNEGIFTPSTSLALQTGAQFENAAGAAFTPLTPFALNAVNGGVQNQGDINLPAGITLTLSGANNFSMSGSSARLVGNGTLDAAAQTLTLSAGAVDGSPIFNVGTLLNNGANLRPGGPNGMIGTITINGNYQQVKVSAMQEGKMEFDLAGIGNTDLLNVSGAVTLGGSLGRGAVGTFAPPVGTVLDVVNAGSVSGSFDGGSELIVFDAPRRYVEVISANKVSLRANETVWVVGDPGDAGSGAPTLRAALNAFGAESGCANAPYSIHFGLPMGMTTVQPASPLPTISTCPGLMIDGYTQSGATQNSAPTDFNAVLPVVLDGASCSTCNGIAINAANTTVRGLRFTGWLTGIAVSATANSTQISGNHISGGTYGIGVAGSNGTQIGGTIAERNVVTGATAHGIDLSSGAFALRAPPIDQTPLRSQPIAGEGGESPESTKEASAPGPSGKRGAASASRLKSGGSPPEPVQTFPAPAGTILIANNMIGVGPGLTMGGNAIGIFADNLNNITIKQNLIKHNNTGVSIATATQVDFVQNNVITANTVLGVDLGNDGPTANDDVTPPYDTDTGANLRLNYPKIVNLVPVTASSATVNYEVRTTPNTSMQVYVCVNPPGGAQCDSVQAVSYGVTTDASGLFAGNFTQTGLNPNETITLFAQATSGPKSGNVSEFSPAVTFGAAAPAVSITGSGMFPSTTVAASSPVQSITITNTGAGPLSISDISNSGAPIFVDTTSGPAPNAAHYCGFGSNAMGQPQTGMPIVIPTMGTCVLNLIFAPGAAGAASGVITINSNAPGSPHTVNLTGTGIAQPNLAIVLPAVAFPGSTVNLQLRLFNFDTGLGLSGADASITYPAGFTNTAPGVLPQAGCGAVLGTYTTGGNSLSASGGGLIPAPMPATSSSCFLATASLNVPMTLGTYTFTIPPGGFTVSNLGYTNSAPITASINVVSAATPTMTVSLSPTSVLTGVNSTLTVTITNPSAMSMTMGTGTQIPFGSLFFAATLSDSCGLGSTNGGTFIGIPAGVVVPPATTCTQTHQFSSATPGMFPFNVNPGFLVTSLGNNTNTSTATLTVTAPTATYSPGTLNFGSLTVGTTSMPQAVTFTNTSAAPISVSSISFVGGGAGFNVLPSSQCLMAPMLASMGSCTFDITATPNAVGALTDNVFVPTTPASATTPANVTLNVTGTAPPTPTMTVAFAPASVNTGVNSTLTITLNNPSASGAGIALGSGVNTPGLSLSGLTDSCGLGAFISTGSVDLGMAGVIPAMGTCTVTVQAQSPMAGTFNVSVVPGNLITNRGNNANSSSTALTVTAAPTGPFAYIPIFTSFTGTTVSVIDLPTNTVATTITVGTGPVGAAVNAAGTRAYISNQQSNSVSVIDTATNTVVATVPVGSQPGSAAVNPAGTRVYVPNQSSNSVSVIDTASNTVTATVTGLGFPSAAVVNPAGSKVFVTLSSANAVGVIDTTSNTLIGSIPVCTGPYQPVINGSGTRVYVVCTSGNVAVIDAGSGTVLATIPVGATPRGIALTPNGAQAWTSNSGSNNVSVIDTASNTVVATLAAGTTPWGIAGNAAGTRMYVANNGSNNVSVFDTASNTVVATVPVGAGPLAIGPFLQPAAVASNPVLSRSQTAVAFGGRTTNTTSPATVVTIGNSGTANLIISGLTISGDFGFTTTCPILTPPIAPLATCTVSITFTPLTVASLAGTLTITSNAPGSPHTIALTGTGLAVAAPAIAVNTSVLNLGGTVVNTTGAQQAVIVTNTGFANLNISGITVSGAGFARVTPSTGSPVNCGTSVAPSGTCQIAVACTPAVVGTLMGMMSIAHNAIGSPTLVNLICTGNAVPVATVALSAALDFGDQVINTSSSARAVSIANTGTAPLTVSSIALTGTDSNQFAQTGVCTSVAAGASCDVLVNFAPTSIGAKSAGLIVTSNAQNAQTTNRVALSGNGVLAPRPVAVPSVTAIGFGNTIFGGASQMQLISFKNEGGLAMTISGVVATGDFTQMNNCGGTLASLASCSINVAFNPLGLGGRSGELQIFTNAQGSPHRIFLSGTGCRWFSQPGSRFFLTAC